VLFRSVKVIAVRPKQISPQAGTKQHQQGLVEEIRESCTTSVECYQFAKGFHADD